jgi:hypothetical protein
MNNKPQKTTQYLSEYLDLDQEFDAVIKDMRTMQERYINQYGKLCLEVETDCDGCLDINVYGVRMETIQEAEKRFKAYEDRDIINQDQRRKRYEELKKEFEL